MTAPHTNADDPGTRGAEQADAQSAHRADRPPTADEERAAETSTPDPSVARAYQDAAETGASIKGEGAIE